MQMNEQFDIVFWDLLIFEGYMRCCLKQHVRWKYNTLTYSLEQHKHT